MKRLAILLVLSASLLIFNCSEKTEGAKVTAGKKPLKVVASFLPIQVFAANVIGTRENVILDSLIPPQGIEPHEFSMTPKDVAKLHEADVVIINGFGFEGWLMETINEVGAESILITASNGVTPIYYSGENPGENKGGHKGDINPHCWASPKAAMKMVQNITKGLSIADPAGALEYAKNAEAYLAQLEALDAQITAAVAGAPNRGIVTFHDAFDYFARDYGVKIIAAIETHPGQEPSAGELAGLVKLIRETNIKVIFAEPQYPKEVAEVIAKETNAEVLILDPYETGTFSLDGYELAWQANLKNLVKALS